MKEDGKGREGEVREEQGWKEKERDGREGKGKVRKGEQRFRDNIGHMWRVIEYDGDIMYNNDKHFDQLLQKSGKNDSN